MRSEMGFACSLSGRRSYVMSGNVDWDVRNLWMMRMTKESKRKKPIDICLSYAAVRLAWLDMWCAIDFLLLLSLLRILPKRAMQIKHKTAIDGPICRLQPVKVCATHRPFRIAYFIGRLRSKSVSSGIGFFYIFLTFCFCWVDESLTRSSTSNFPMWNHYKSIHHVALGFIHGYQRLSLFQTACAMCHSGLKCSIAAIGKQWSEMIVSWFSIRHFKLFLW